MNKRQQVGRIGEEYAMNYLCKHGFKIVKHHYTTHWGELDIIAKKDNKICFIEVKTRVGDSKGKPYEAIGYYKIRSLKRAITTYLITFPASSKKFSLDVASITLNKDLSVNYFQYFENAVPF